MILFRKKEKSESLKTRFHRWVCVSMTSGALVGAMTLPVSADPMGTMENLFSTYIGPWLIAAGVMVALVGGVQFALSWQREDSEGKSRAVMTLMAGAMIASIGAGGWVIFSALASQ